MTIRTNPLRRALALALCALAVGLAPLAAAADSHDAELPPGPSQPLEPSVEPAPVPGRRIYTGEYVFALTRSVASSTLVPAAQLPLFFLTIPIDAAFLPLALVAGFFPGD